MEDNIKSISTDLFYKVRSKFSGLKLGTETGEVTINPEDAVFFDFDYMEGDNPIGHVSISLAETGSMKVYYSTGITEAMDSVQKDGWYTFLKSMRAFAKRRLMSFDTRDIAKEVLDKRDYAFLSQYGGNSTVGESTMNEGMYGTNKTSYQKLEDTKLIVKHTKQVDETQPGSRSRNISGLFIENSSGERFKYPFIHLAGARAMQRHVQEGGLPYDEIGQYIVSLSEQLAQLRSFGNYVVKNDLMNSETNGIVERSKQALEDIRTTIKRLSGKNFYNEFKENFKPVENTQIPNEIVDDLTSKFTVRKFNEELKDVFPIIHQLMMRDEDRQETDVVETEENLKDHFSKFENWVQKLGEESSIESSDEEERQSTIEKLNKLVGDHFAAGMDGTNAIQSLESIGIKDQLLMKQIKELSKEDSNACVRPLIKSYLENLVREGKLSQDEFAKVDFGDMTEEGAEEIQEKFTSKDLAEFIYSFYDKETGKFPKGETGVLTMVEKKFGDRAAKVANGFIQKLSSKQDEGILDTLWGASKDAIRDPSVDYDKVKKDSDFVYDLQDAGYSDKQIKMAYGILNDPRYKQGNLKGALAAIEKIAPGMSEEPAIQNAIRATQESIETDEKLSIGQQMARDGIKYSRDKEKEIIGQIGEYMKKSGYSEKQIRYYLNYDEDFIPDVLGELPRDTGESDELNRIKQLSGF